MSEHKWLTSRRLQEAHLHIYPELNWNSAPLTSSYSPGVCGRKQRPAQHNKTTNHQWSTDKQTKWAEGNLTTAFCVSSPEVNEAYYRVSKREKEREVSCSKLRAALTKWTETNKAAREQPSAGELLTSTKRHVRSCQLHAWRRKWDRQRRVLVLTFKDAVKSMEFSCSGCFSEHSTLSAFTPKIET